MQDKIWKTMDTLQLIQFSGLNLKNKDDDISRKFIRGMILDCQDQYGNTMLHIAAKNGKADMFDHLVEMGADRTVKNLDGLSPFTMTTRFGIWDMFHHIWDKHLTIPIWKFGNVEKYVTSIAEFDWKGHVSFAKRKDLNKYLQVLVNEFASNHGEIVGAIEEICTKIPMDNQDSWIGLYRKILFAKSIRAEWCQKQVKNQLHFQIGASIGFDQPGDRLLNDDSDWIGKDDGIGDALSGIRLITLFRPKGWYKETKEKIEKVILNKWAQGFYLIHIGSNVLPYCINILLFGLMWWKRELHILEHNFWWADTAAVHKLESLNTSSQILGNPVKANISELEASMKKSILGIDPRDRGLLPDSVLGPESMCGWKSIWTSYSGNLQAALVFYAVPSLLRLAYCQRRIRPSDLDEDENMMISFEEVVNFIYSNLESLLHLVMCCLLIIILAARVNAGEECDGFYLAVEMSATSIASLFLFFNLFVVCKPYEGIGLLVLTIYKFLVSDVFNFLVMYAIFFVSFLIALQTLHNSNHVFLAWMDRTEVIAPQIVALTDDMAYLQNANIISTTRMQDTQMAIVGCQKSKRTLQDTAFILLEISFGDGLSDALEQARKTEYECPGYATDGLSGILIVIWVFLTNVLILNMLIAMMNYTFEKQTKNVHSVWVLDVSYRIMRYERLFPELVARLQRPVRSDSLWNSGYWLSFFSDVLLMLYCLPELHLWGYGHVFFSKVKYLCQRPIEPEEAWKASIEKVWTAAFNNANKSGPSSGYRSNKKGCCTHSASIWNSPRIRMESLSRSANNGVQLVLADWDSLVPSLILQLKVKNIDAESARHTLVLIAIMHELHLIQANFDQQRSVAQVLTRRTPEAGGRVADDDDE
jgi:hypothetical protein